MIKESIFYKILSAIHFVLYTSLLCFGITFLSLTLFLLPAAAAAFRIGKDYLYKNLDITDSIIKTYLRYFKASFPLLRFVPMNLILVLNAAGLSAILRTKNMFFSQNTAYAIVCLIILAFLLTFSLYLAGFHTFVSEQFQCVEVLLAMFYKPLYLIPVLTVSILCVVFFSGALLLILLFTGTFFLFALEVIIFIQLLHYKKAAGLQDKEDEFSYLTDWFQKKN